MKAARPTCAICWVDPNTGRAGTNRTTKICKACKFDPANVDWVVSPREVPVAVSPSLTVDAAIRNAVRDVLREVMRDEVRLAVRDEMARFHEPVAASRANGDGYLSIAEAARIANVHQATVRSWIGKGNLPGYRAGRHRRVRRVELDRFMASLSDEKVIDLDRRATELAAA